MLFYIKIMFDLLFKSHFIFSYEHATYYGYENFFRIEARGTMNQMFQLRALLKRNTMNHMFLRLVGCGKNVTNTSLSTLYIN